MDAQNIKQTIMDVLKELNLYNLHDIFGREHNPLDGRHRKNEGVNYADLLNNPLSGMICIFDKNCPSGWTRVSAFDGLFLRAAATYGGTGDGSHQHAVGTLSGSQPTHTHSASQPNHQHGGSVSGTTGYEINHAHDGVTTNAGITGDAGAHDHSFSDSFTTNLGGNDAVTVNANGNDPVTISGSVAAASPFNFIDVVFCKKD